MNNDSRKICSNGTVLDLIPMGQVLAIIGMLLLGLFTLIKPEASHGLEAAGRFIFWMLHVGLGFGALWVSSWWLRRGGMLPASTLGSVFLTGCAAILIAAPGYLALDAVYKPFVIDLDPDPLSAWLPVQVFQEALELAPWFMVTWLIINLPVLLPKNDSHVDVESTPPDKSRNLTLPALQLISEDTTQQRTSSNKALSQNTFLESLPTIVGTDVIAISSDLHYLKVWTSSGRSTVLGNLRDATDELSDIGMQVHRSHWVAHDHVKRVVSGTGGMACILSNELRVPISRRRWKQVREHYGRGVVDANVKIKSNS